MGFVPSVISVMLLGVVLGVLALMPNIMLGDALLAWLVLPSSFASLSFALGVLIIAGVWAQQFKRIHKILAVFICCMMVGVLFIIRTMMAYVQFEESTINQSHAVTVTAHISEISDSIYDPLSDSMYRQSATITDIQPIEHSQKSHAIIFTNPFGNSNMSDSVNSNAIKLPKRMNVLLSATPKHNKDDQVLSQLNDLTPNTIAQLTLQIEPLNMNNSANGFDGNMWLRTRQIHATARVLSIDGTDEGIDASLATQLQRLRQRLRVHFYEDWHQHDLASQQARAVTLSLLTGDRSLIDRQTKNLYQFAGISHLLAISGTHVVFLALMLATMAVWVVDKICPKTYVRISRWQIRMIVMLLASLLYAVFTGFDVPAVRTVYMLGGIAVVRYLVLPISNVMLLLVVALTMVWLDPYVLWQAGFWLSFMAVFLLMQYKSSSALSASIWVKMWQNIKNITMLQLWLFVAMLPISMLFFGKVSLWGILINLFAVGLFGAIIVPINLLAGVVFVIMPNFADELWSLSSWILLKLHTMFEFGLVGDAWLYSSFGMAGLLFGALAILPMISKVVPKSAVVIPLSVLFMLLMNGYFYPSKDTQPIAKIIKTDNRALQAVLIQYQSQSWLLLADFGIQSLPDRQIDTLIDKLKRFGVHHLTGVITQNSTQKLAELTAVIHTRLPIERYWRAGRNGPKLASLVDEPCQAGRVYQSGGMTIRALTGWQQINDAKVWDCTIEIGSNLGFKIDYPADIKSDVVLPMNTQHIIVNAAYSDDVWRLWRLLCADTSIMPHIKPSDGVLWLSHILAKDDADVVDEFQATTWQER